MTDILIQLIRAEMAQIEQLLTTYRALLDRVHEHQPDAIELAALATVLHSFYNGVEGIFLTIAKRIDDHVPDTARWHRSLLAQMSNSRDKRPAVISQSLEIRLTQHLAFRHYFRHSYAFTLEWSRLEPLVNDLSSTHREFQQELTLFLRLLTTADGTS